MDVMHIPEFKSDLTFIQIAKIFSIIAINGEKELLREHKSCDSRTTSNKKCPRGNLRGQCKLLQIFSYNNSTSSPKVSDSGKCHRSDARPARASVCLGWQIL